MVSPKVVAAMVAAACVAAPGECVGGLFDLNLYSTSHHSTHKLPSMRAGAEACGFTTHNMVVHRAVESYFTPRVEK